MPLYDTQNSSEPVRQAEVQHAGVFDRALNWLDVELTAVAMKGKEKIVGSQDAQTYAAIKDAHTLRNQGQIKEMEMPMDWSEGARGRGPYPNSALRCFHPHETEDANLYFYYRGSKIDDGSAASFHALLAKPAHVLAPSELKSIAAVIGDKSNAQDFRMLNARTEEINGKRVLIVEGRYELLQLDTYHAYVDADNEGKAVQEVFYKAPKGEYPKYFKAATDSIKSIQWK